MTQTYRGKCVVGLFELGVTRKNEEISRERERFIGDPHETPLPSTRRRTRPLLLLPTHLLRLREDEEHIGELTRRDMLADDELG